MTPETPPEFMIRTGLRLLVASGFVSGARALRLDEPSGFDRALEAAPKVAGGRGPHFVLASEHWPGRVRLRPIRRGGFLGCWGSDLYASPRRSEDEFRVWQSLEARGAPVPRVAFAANRRRGPFWNPSLGVLDQQRATDVLAWLQAAQRPPESLAVIAAAIARSIRRFHDAGALHGDFHPRNVLLEDSPSGTRVSLVDLGRTRLGRVPSTRERMRELMRFRRFLEKSNQSACLRARVRARFLDAYCDGDRRLRRALLDSAPAEERRIRRHRWGWRLRRILAGGLVSLFLFACSEAGDTGERPAPKGSLDSPRLSLLAVGDTGRSRFLGNLFEGQLAVAYALSEEDVRDPVDAVILLGDNFYWRGLDAEHLVDRVRRNLVIPYCHFLDLDGPRSTEVAGDCPLDPSSRNPVPFYAVLGNHDLERPQSAALQREVVPEFLPGWHMSSSLAEVFELPDGVSLILFESEMAIDDAEAMQTALVRAIQTAKGPWRVIATHRPIATDDLGGVPLGGYPIWVRDAIAAAGRPVQLVLAGHHHNLQAFALHEPSALLQIGAGSGSRALPPLASDPPGSLFGAIQLGFARVDLVGAAASERLVVSLHGNAPWPIWARLSSHEELARFEVDLEGSVRTLSITGGSAAGIEGPIDDPLLDDRRQHETDAPTASELTD
jgi:tRNA A-37 threonylcarbamoyl transferase component Bud32